MSRNRGNLKSTEKLNPQFYKPSKSKTKMGTALFKIKVMPSSPEVDLEKIKEEITKLLKDAKNLSYEEEPVAFGLKAIIISFGWDEKLEFEPLENQMNEIENVGSVQVIDMRREFG